MSIRQVAEMGAAIALAVVLGLLTRWVQMPYGGSIHLGGLPILVLALRRGVRLGLASGALYGFVYFVLNPFYFHPIQVVLDYPLAFACLGVVGLAGSAGRGWRGRLLLALAVALAGLLRLAAHWVSGVVFFAQLAPAGQPVWLYSLTYNISYVIPEHSIYILCLEVLPPSVYLAARKEKHARS